MTGTDTRPIRVASGPVEGSVRPPGSKSITNRALVVASLVGEGSVSRLTGGLEAGDTMVMRNGLRALGVRIDDVDDPWLVLGTGGRVTGGSVDAGASGTTARFLTAVGALASEPVTVDGTPRMRERPISDLLEALAGLGAVVESAGGYPPVTVTGPVTAGATSVGGATSSQFLSALLMIAPVLDGVVDIAVTGGLVSRPYVTGTIEVMTAFGARVRADESRFVVEPTGYVRAHLDIEADASAAVYPATAVAIAGGRVVIRGIPPGSSQPDLAVLGLLVQMGCHVDSTSGGIVVEHDGSRLRAVDADLSGSPDGSLAVAVACLFADGPSRLRGLGTLRVKETDRLRAMSTELRRLGAGAEIEGDDLIITPRPLRGATVETYDDHRMAMSLALAGLRTRDVSISDPSCVSKTWPGYFEVLEDLCRS